MIFIIYTLRHYQRNILGAFVIYCLGAVCQSCILQGLEKNPKCTQGRCGYSVVGAQLFVGSFTGGWRDSNDHDNPHTTLSINNERSPKCKPLYFIIVYDCAPRFSQRNFLSYLGNWFFQGVRFCHSWLPLSCHKSSVNSGENSTSPFDELLRNPEMQCDLLLRTSAVSRKGDIIMTSS